MKLTEDQWETVVHALSQISARDHLDATNMQLAPRVREQFARQSEEAKQLALEIENRPVGYES